MIVTLAAIDHLARDLLVVLSTAALVALLLRRAHLAVIPGFLVAGALIGPAGLGWVRDAVSTEAIGHLATILLMFTIGLHLDLAQLRGGLLPTAFIGVVSTLLSTLLVWPVAMALGSSAPAALVIAMAFSMSSTALVLRILQQRRVLHRIDGRLAFGVLLLQDFVALVMLALIPLVGAWAASSGHAALGSAPMPDVAELVRKGSLAIAGIAGLIVASRLIVPRLLGEAARSRTGDALIIVSAAIALGSAVLTAVLGFSPELGAFLAGFMLASTPFRYQLAGQLVPMRDLFIAVFFTSVGLAVPLGEIAHGWPAILAMLVSIVVIKAVVIGLTSWAAGASAPVAVYAGMVLAQGGEFSLIILSRAESVISPAANARAIAAVAGSLIVTPLLFALADVLSRGAHRISPAPWIRHSALRATPVDKEGAVEAAAPVRRAIIAGFGPVGRAVADQLERRAIRPTIIELNPRTVERQHKLGRSIVYGDAANAEVLESAGLARADAVILTMPDEEAMLRACRLVRSARPDVFIAARTNVLNKGLQAMQQGADHVVVEEMATAEAMAAQVIRMLERRDAGEDVGPRLYVE